MIAAMIRAMSPRVVLDHYERLDVASWVMRRGVARIAADRSPVRPSQPSIFAAITLPLGLASRGMRRHRSVFNPAKPIYQGVSTGCAGFGDRIYPSKRS